MRVISGKARGMRLKAVPGETTRPILDRAKESLFNILGSFVVGTRWLDLFGGTGQVGIEALSRGAAEVVFADKARLAVRTIWQNLKHTRLGEGAVVEQVDAFLYLARLARGDIAPFDVVYVAPPQYLGLWVEALRLLDGAGSTAVAEGGMVVVQIDPSEYCEVDLKNLVLTDKRKYGRTLFCFYEG